jgi:hypothetical protein
MGEGEGGGECPNPFPLTSILSHRGERRYFKRLNSKQFMKNNWEDEVNFYFVNMKSFEFPDFFYEFLNYNQKRVNPFSNTNKINKMASPPPSPSPLEGEGRVGGKMRLY